METIYTIRNKQTRLGVVCGSDHELLIVKFRLKLKKLWKTTRTFRYDLNQISYDYIVEVTNRFKGLDLIDRVPGNYGRRFMTLYRRQWSRPYPRKKKMQKDKMLVWGCLTNSWEKKRSERKGRKGKIYLFEFRVPKNGMETYKSLPQRSIQWTREKQ